MLNLLRNTPKLAQNIAESVFARIAGVVLLREARGLNRIHFNINRPVILLSDGNGIVSVRNPDIGRLARYACRIRVPKRAKPAPFKH